MTKPPCPICRQAELRPMIAFDDVPVTGIFPDAAATTVPVRRLAFAYCPCCAGVVQLPGRGPAMDYVHIGRPTARQLPGYVDAIVGRVAAIGRAGGLVVEVGCNDGGLLGRLRDAGCSALIGIEPSNRLAAMARAGGHAVEALPLTATNADAVVRRHGLADAVVCRHTLEHVPDPRDFLLALRLLLKPGGLLVVEVPSLAPIIERMHIHELWDEHVSYFLPGNLAALLRASGFERIAVAIERLRDSDSIVCDARAGDPGAADFGADGATVARCADFRDAWQERSARLRRAAAALPRPRVALGASHPQANFLNFSGIAALVDAAIDDDPFKAGKYLPLLGRNVPIFPSAMLAEKSAGGTLLLTGFGYPEWMDRASRAVADSAIVFDVDTESLSGTGQYRLMKQGMPACHLCGAPKLEAMPHINDFVAISSDIRVVDGTLRLAVCQACGALQKPATPGWQRAVAALYAGYDINHQGGGSEPFIFNSVYGPGPRADILLAHLDRHTTLRAEGRMLDIGCANGNILRSFGSAHPGWSLSGLDRSSRWRDTILSLPGVEGFFADPSELGERRFDLIIMSHVLEHISDPATFLCSLRAHLEPGGLLYIAVPDIRQNPVDLFVLDHCTHFDECVLFRVLVESGFAPSELRSDILGKEIIAIAQVGGDAAFAPPPFAMALAAVAEHYLAVCGALRRQAREMRRRSRPFGILGTATAAVWLYGELGQEIDFFADEDPQRIGKGTLGRPVLALDHIPSGAGVFIPMSVNTAQGIITRAGRSDVNFAYANENDIDGVTLKQAS